MNRLVVLLLAVIPLALSGQVSLPAASPTQTLRQQFGTGSIELTYSRPSMKSRTIFGGLESWGKVWRMGANEATRIRFTLPVRMGGVAIDTGTYVLYAIPNPTEWTLIVNKGVKNWGAQGYNETDDVARFTIKPRPLRDAVETLTIQFTNFTQETCDFEMTWEKTKIQFTIAASLREVLRQKVEQGLAAGQTNPWTAAEFYFHWDKNYSKSLEYTEKALAAAESKGRKVPWMYLLKAKNEWALGDNAAAKASAKKCVQLARETNFESYANQGLELLKKVR